MVLYVGNLNEHIGHLRAAGVHFRNQVEVGPGGSQIQIDDPDGNPIELHEALPQPSRRTSNMGRVVIRVATSRARV